jgi:hypothetical protein
VLLALRSADSAPRELGVNVFHSLLLADVDSARFAEDAGPLEPPRLPFSFAVD